MGTEELQEQLKSLISEMNWKLPKVAEVLYVSLNDDEVLDEEKEIKKFYEKLKGQLKRRTTSPKLLENYINLITNHPEYIKSNIISTRYVPSNTLSQSLRSNLGEISKGITKRINKNNL